MMIARRFSLGLMLALVFGIGAGSPLTTTGKAQDEPAKNDTAEPTQRTIYVPYDKLREVFEKPGRGVFLTYEEFQRLSEAARAARPQPVVERSPAAVVLTESESEATVEADVVRVRARLKVDLLRPGWHEVPLRLADAAILSATIDGRPAPIVTDAGGQHKLIVHNESKRPTEARVELEYARAYSKAEGRHRVALAAPQAAVSRWRIRIPQPGVQVEVRPLVAATVEPSAEGGAAKETVLLAFVGAAPQVDIQWTPKAEGASGLAAVVTVQAEEEVKLESGALRTQVRLALSISRAELAKVAIIVPAGQKVINVFDPNVRKWSVAAGEGGQQRIDVELFEPRLGAQALVVDLERFAEDERAEVGVPVVQVLDSARQQGTVVVRVPQGLRAEPIRYSGLSQIDAADLPPGLARQPFDFAYRYAGLPFDLALRVEKTRPKIHATELVEAFLDPQRARLLYSVVLDVQQSGIFQVPLEIPAGYDVRQVRGVAIGEAKPAAVDAHHVTGAEKSRLQVDLSSRAEGKVALVVELERRIDDANLAAVTGKQSELPVAIPRVVRDAVEQASGWLVVYAPESLQVNPGAVNGATSVPATEAYAAFAGRGSDGFSRSRPVLAYSYSLAPADWTLLVERRRPQVTVAQLLLVRAKPGLISYEATLHYDVKYSSVKSLRLDVPTELVGQIRTITPGFREQRIDPQPKDTAEKYTAWTLTGQNELLGSGSIKLAWEKKLDNLDVGKSVKIDVPRLVPRDVDRAWGQVVLTKEESIDIAPTGEPHGLQPKDPQHELMPGASVPDAAGAFEFQDDWGLSLMLARYQPEELKQTSIEQAVVRMVCTRADTVSVQALYRLKSARQRLKFLLPADHEFDTDPVRINGRTVPVERGEEGENYVPLAGQTPEKPFVLELRYVTRGGAGQLDLPQFPDEPAVQKVTLCVYVPQEQAVLGSRGPWTGARGLTTLLLTSWPSRNEDARIHELVNSIDVHGTPATDFPTDGQLYMYSTLAPAPAPQGSLRLATFDRDWLNGLVFGLVLIGGLVMLRSPVRKKIFVVAAFLAALLLAGVFLPTLTVELLQGYIFVAALLVLIVWGAWLVVSLVPNAASRPRWTAPRASEPSVAEPPAAPPVETTPPTASGEPPPETPAEQGDPMGDRHDG